MSGYIRIFIDVTELGRLLNVRETYIYNPDGTVARSMDGDEIVLQDWSVSQLRDALRSHIAPVIRACPEGEYLLINSPRPWITLALYNAMLSLGARTLYSYGPKELDLKILPQGEPLKELKIDFEVIENGDDVFVNLNSDAGNPNPHGHNFDLDRFDDIVIPPVPEGKNVFVYGKGMFGVMVGVARSYIPKAASVFLANGPEEVPYVCVASSREDIVPGDIRPRSVPCHV